MNVMTKSKANTLNKESKRTALAGLTANNS